MQLGIIHFSKLFILKFRFGKNGSSARSPKLSAAISLRNRIQAARGWLHGRDDFRHTTHMYVAVHLNSLITLINQTFE